ncbi:hypothetical protein K2173_003310 [Erythroxylum novogranatense]|uniref:Uncharacterized protein n=1 Tax=Erythroxylum novogranatense TaxID=1862640 RepID=A0AAV8SX77_9ROSI|nr:hypothetical protein K2173_003310 [Erythroxylum novogranatense]
MGGGTIFVKHLCGATCGLEEDDCHFHLIKSAFFQQAWSSPLVSLVHSLELISQLLGDIKDWFLQDCFLEIDLIERLERDGWGEQRII